MQHNERYRRISYRLSIYKGGLPQSLVAHKLLASCGPVVIGSPTFEGTKRMLYGYIFAAFVILSRFENRTDNGLFPGITIETLFK